MMASRTTGLRRKDIVGKKVTEVLPGIEKDPADWIGTYGRVALTGETLRFDQHSELLGRWYAVSSYSPEKGCFVATFSDITERKHSEEALQRARDELEARVVERTTELSKSHELLEQRVKERTAELERSNAELQQFAYVASHDLQEPLRMVASYVGLLSQRYKGQLDGDADEFINFAVDGATRMQTLISDLLAYSRVGTQGQPLSPTNSGAALDRALTNLRVAVAENHAVVTNDPLPTVLADASQLVEVFQNLIGNALKFHGPEHPRVHVSAERIGDERVFAVRDNGIGTAAEYQDRIFVIFQRLQSRMKYPGTGIGLVQPG